MHLKHLFISLIFLGLATLKAQQNKVHDSLFAIYRSLPNDTTKVNILHELQFSILYNNAELAKKYSEEQLMLATKLEFTRQIGKAYYNLAAAQKILGEKDSARINNTKAKNIFTEIGSIKNAIFANRSIAILDYEKGDLEKALSATKKNIEDRKAIKDTNGIAQEYKFIATIYESKGNLERSYDYSIKAIDMFKKTDDSLGLADAIYGIASIESGLGNYLKSIKHAQEALPIYEVYNDKLYQALTLGHIGGNFSNLKRYDKALIHLTKALRLAQEVKAPVFEGLVLRDLGNTYAGLDDFRKAENFLKQAIDLGEKNKRPEDVMSSSNSLGELYNENNLAYKALPYLNKAISLSDSLGVPASLTRAYRLRSSAHQKLKQFEMALEDYKLFKTIADSVYTLEKTKEIEKLRTIYETEKKEQQIKNQKNEIDLLNIKGRVNKLQRLLLGLGLLLALISTYAFYVRNKRNKLAKDNAQADLEYKTKELTTHALHLAKKNEVLSDLKAKAKALKADADADPGYQMLIQTINFDLQDDNNWENFSRYFEEVHKDFNAKAKEQFPNITSNDLRLMSLLKMNLSSKEIANILNISSDGIKKARQRLRKKMGIASNASLEAIVIAI